MNYLYEIQVLENKIRNNYEKIERLEQSRSRITNECVALQTMNKGKIQINGMDWQGRTTEIPEEIIRWQYGMQQNNINQQEDFVYMLGEKIAYLERENEQYRMEIKRLELI
jgi:hypothetical protein